jgi:hypothetical protein
MDELLGTIERWRQEIDSADVSIDYWSGYDAACLSVISWIKNQQDDTLTSTAHLCPSCHARPLVSGQETCAACSQY